MLRSLEGCGQEGPVERSAPGAGARRPWPGRGKAGFDACAPSWVLRRIDWGSACMGRCVHGMGPIRLSRAHRRWGTASSCDPVVAMERAHLGRLEGGSRQLGSKSVRIWPRSGKLRRNVRGIWSSSAHSPPWRDPPYRTKRRPQGRRICWGRRQECGRIRPSGHRRRLGRPQLSGRQHMARCPGMPRGRGPWTLRLDVCVCV